MQPLQAEAAWGEAAERAAGAPSPVLASQAVRAFGGGAARDPQAAGVCECVWVCVCVRACVRARVTVYAVYVRAVAA